MASRPDANSAVSEQEISQSPSSGRAPVRVSGRVSARPGIISAARPIARRTLGAWYIGLCAAVWAALYLPFLGIGWFLDDYLFLPRFARGEDGLSLYAFAQHGVERLIHDGALPWWTSPDFRLSFLRPLTGLSLHADHALWGPSPLGWHLHSAIWGLVFFIGCGALYRRVLPGAVAVVALLVVTLSVFMTVPVLWISNRHVLIGLSAALAGLNAHIAARESGLRLGRTIALCAFALGLLASEASLCGIAYLYAYELTQRGRSWGSRLLALLPVTVLCALYLFAYAKLGLGASGSGAYHSPLQEPLSFLSHAPAALGQQLYQLFAFPFVVDSAIARAALGYGLLALFGAILWGTVWRRGLISRSRVAFFVLGIAGALLPTFAGPTQPRMLPVALIGVAPLIAAAIVQAAREFSASRERHWFASAAAAYLALLYLGFAPLGHIRRAFALGEDGASALAIAKQPALQNAAHAHRDVIVMHAPTYLLSFYTRPVMEHLFHRSPAWFPLTGTLAPGRFERVSERTLELSLGPGPVHASELEELLHAASFQPGQRVGVDAFEVEVVQVQAGYPSKLRYHFAAPLEAPRYQFMAFADHGLRVVSPPALGESFELPRDIRYP